MKRQLTHLRGLSGLIIALLVYDLAICTSSLAQQPIRYIPVVVHSVWHTNLQAGGTTPARAASQIATLNDGFRLRIDGQRFYPDRAADTYIEFFLAPYDIDGTQISGFVRDTTDLNELSQGSVASWANAKMTKFPPSKYLNIFVGIMAPNWRGWCLGPGGNPDAAFVGSGVFGITAPGGGWGNHIAIHEVGHWLGLHHLWEYPPGGQCKDDGVPDTPPQARDLQTCDYDAYACDASGPVMLENFMQVCPDECTNMFTAGQKGVMDQTLSGSRSSVLWHTTEPFANRRLSDATNLGGTLTVYSWPVNSTSSVIVPASGPFKARTDSETLSSLKHLKWNDTRIEYKLERNVDYSVVPKPDEEKAYFESRYPITLNVGLIENGSTYQGSVELLDPWFVEADGSQPENWKTYASGFSGNLFLQQGGLNFERPCYSVRAPWNQAINNFDSYFVKWRVTGGSAAFDDSCLTQTGVVFNSGTTSVAAFYKAHLGTNSPTMADAKNQRRLLREQNSYWTMVYESMGNVYLTASRDGGATWWVEEKLNTRDGYASNPSLSNIVWYNSQAHGIISWIEVNQSGVAEMHLQTFRMFTGGGYTPHPVWYGWTGDGERSSQNHMKISDLLVGDVAPRSDSRPVLSIGTSGTLFVFTYALEQLGSGIWYGDLFGDFSGLHELADFTPDPLSPTVVSTNTSDKQPVLMEYPASFGQNAGYYLYYLGAGYPGYAYRVVEYNRSTGQTRLLPNGYTESSYSSLQGAVNPSAANFGIVAQADAYNGSLVNYYEKTTWSTQASLRYVYLNMTQPTVMVETMASPGSPSAYIFMKSTNNSWYQMPPSQSMTLIGPSTAGFFTRERIPSGDRASMAVRTTSTPSRIQYYSGSGQLQKVNVDGVPLDVRSIAFWKDEMKEGRYAILDFTGTPVHPVDVSADGRELCAVELLDIPGGNVVSQLDSLATGISVQVVRSGGTVASLPASNWSQLSVSTLGGLLAGDTLRFTLPTVVDSLWAYTEFALRNANVAKHEIVTQPPPSELPKEVSLVAYPNPFNPSTSVRFALPEAGHVSLRLYDVLGREAATLAHGYHDAGYHAVTWYAQDAATGVYYARLVVSDEVGRIKFSNVTKLLLMK